MQSDCPQRGDGRIKPFPLQGMSTHTIPFIWNGTIPLQRPGILNRYLYNAPRLGARYLLIYIPFRFRLRRHELLGVFVRDVPEFVQSPFYRDHKLFRASLPSLSLAISPPACEATIGIPLAKTEEHIESQRLLFSDHRLPHLV